MKRPGRKEKMKIKLLFFVLLVGNVLLYARLDIKKPQKEHATSFAIIVDEKTYSKTKDAILAYRDAVEDDGLSTYVLVDDWKSPDEIKEEIQKLYHQTPPLEGVVFIGDIPIPMLRNVDHLTSSFKYENNPSDYYSSSVPSDRFYDDFNLKFTFLHQDSEHPLCFYYSLTPDSPQKVNKTIYSARIKPSVDDESKYTLINQYLTRVVKEKKQQNKLDNMLVYTGERYFSESLAAWGDEQLSLREEFPQVFKAGGRMKKLNHTMSPYMKGILLSEIQDPKLDFAVFHAHGDDNLQSLIDNPRSNDIDDNIENIKLTLRKELRDARHNGENVNDKKKELKEDYNVPDSWFDGAFDPKVVSEDSLNDYKMTIYGDDIRKISPQAKLILFDNCYNGAFHTSPYLAGEYVFGYGATIAGIANSTTTLQDQWAEEFSGVLNYGTRVGLWHKMNNELESHLFGDPTFHFTTVDPRVNLNYMLTQGVSDTATWERMRYSDEPSLRALAVKMLFKIKGASYENELLSAYRTEDSFNVRLAALTALAELNTPSFDSILKESIQDPFEFIRRVSAVWMGKVGNREYLSIMAKQLVTDESERVIFDLKKSIAFIDPVAGYEELEKSLKEMPDAADKENLREMMKGSILNSNDHLNKELLPNIKNDSLRIRKKVKEIESLRVYNYIQAVPELLQLAQNSREDVAIRVATLEALGWYALAYNRDAILKTCDEIISAGDTPQQVKDEALRTKNRIKEGFNNPVTS
ncbi:MAG TPA: HEAT repeat domain-containing protein [Ignavibacteriales bacterium]|nr:HEAT repeat domain-containing protein [Ignavibacteriales bacterium]